MSDCTHKVFLLSPANSAGLRTQMLLNSNAGFDLAVRLRSDSASLGELFSFASGLYFRGKMEYSRAFAGPPPGAPASLVITPARGLLPPETLLTMEELRAMGSVPIDLEEPRYLQPFARDAAALRDTMSPDCAVVLLGSIATPKYVAPLLDVFGDRLLFPEEFVGRGDMSRGGLMLRCAREGNELRYVPAASAIRRGQRPPRLPKLIR